MSPLVDFGVLLTEVETILAEAGTSDVVSADSRTLIHRNLLSLQPDHLNCSFYQGFRGTFCSGECISFFGDPFTIYGFAAQNLHWMRWAFSRIAKTKMVKHTKGGYPLLHQSLLLSFCK